MRSTPPVGSKRIQSPGPRFDSLKGRLTAVVLRVNAVGTGTHRRGRCRRCGRFLRSRSGRPGRTRCPGHLGASAEFDLTERSMVLDPDTLGIRLEPVRRVPAVLEGSADGSRADGVAEGPVARSAGGVVVRRRLARPPARPRRAREVTLELSRSQPETRVCSGESLSACRPRVEGSRQFAGGGSS